MIVQTFYSPTTKGFYNNIIHGDKLPDDVVEITEEEHQNLLLGEINGQLITVVDHKVVLVDPPPPPLDDAKAMQAAVVSQAFETALLAGYMTTLNIKMDATLEALQKLKTGYDFAKLVGNTKMSLVDYGNAAHADMPLADVEKIMKEVGGNYQALYLKKQMLRGQVLAATTAEQVAAVVWP